MRLVIAAFLLAGSACAADAPSAPGGETGAMVADVEELALDEGHDDGACACADDTCFGEWVASNIGCGVCVHATCGDRTLEACVPCDP